MKWASARVITAQIRQCEKTVFRRLLIAFSILLACSAARSEIVIEVGPNFVLDEFSDSGTLLVKKQWQGKYSVGIGYMTSMCLENDFYVNFECEWSIPHQWMVGVERRFGWRRWAIGIGLYYVDDLNRVSSNHFNIRSSLEYAITDKFAVQISHLSNGGTGSTMEVCNVPGACVTGDFNLGINTLAFAWRF